MKAKIILSTIALFVLLLNSCEKVEFGNDFLDKDPSGGDVTRDTIFNSYLYANRYLTSAYSSLPYGLPTAQTNKGFKMAIDVLESLTDLNHTYSLTWGTVNKLYYNMDYNATIESVQPFNTKYPFSGRGNWAAIRICWDIIENADRIPDSNPEAIKKMKAEAKMIIALHYCDMYRHYGGLPWVDRTYTASEVPQIKRSTSLETLNKIVALIDEAAADLSWVNADKNDDGRFTKASALGLKARILLFGASPLFNSKDGPYLGGEASSKFYTYHGGYNADLWKRAADAAKELLDGAEANGYKLVSTGNFRKDFQDAYYKRANGEVLISTRVRFAGLDFWNAAYIWNAAASEYGVACPTKEYVDMFPMSNGLKTTDPGSGYDANYPYANRDPRLYETVLVNGDPQYQGRTVELYEDGSGLSPKTNGRETLFGAPLTRTGFKLRKFLLDTDRNFASNTRGIPVHWPYLRLAEIYLTYAEALNEVNDGPTPDAYEAVNKVRNRVGLGDLKTGLSKNQFTEAILTERALEFGYEEVRWYDIIRRKMDYVFTNRLHGEYTKATNAAKTTFRYETRELPLRKWNNDFSPKWYLSAFPATEVNKGYGLTQNPGWE